MAELAMTRWSCGACEEFGIVTYDKGAGVYEVVDLLRADHHAVSPECFLDLAAVRVEVAI